MTTPTVTLVDTTITGRKEFRIEGGDLANGWHARPGNIAWCNFSIYNGGEYICSYGGEVWLGAWPSLFQKLPDGSHGSGGYRLTAAGQAIVSNASNHAP